MGKLITELYSSLCRELKENFSQSTFKGEEWQGLQGCEGVKGALQEGCKMEAGAGAVEAGLWLDPKGWVGAFCLVGKGLLVCWDTWNIGCGS